MSSVTWIEITGTRYSHGNVVVIDTDLVPEFGIIEDIIVDALMCYYFVLEKLHTVCFSNHYHSFEVIKHVPKEFFICKPSDLFDHAVLGLYHIPQCHSLFVCLKYYLVENI